ncbi:MAG: CDC27 family protein [Crocinitomicaceae bacterium]|nr:CDC27 family protein [Crocinitomicaceae bacterium]MBK8925958.1 CDC27 family protein [Crocinitomicaceae bacterium]
MSLKPPDINELISSYFSGTLSEREKNILEKMALDDPFIQDAMDGYSLNPNAIQTTQNTIKIRTKKFHSGLLISGLVITSALVTILVVNHGNKPSQADQANQHTDSMNKPEPLTEIDLIPNYIDSLIPAIEHEIVASQEIINSSTNRIESLTPENEETDHQIIDILEENESIPDDITLIPEKEINSKAEFVPATYLYDMVVVDYRRIEREKTEIIYTKYEFSGTSAEFESEEKEKSTELLEKEVSVSYWEYLSKAMEFFSRGDFKRALSRYEIILSQFETDANGLFYGGLCYFNLSEYDKALQFFENLLKNPVHIFDEDAQWYKGKSLLKLKRIEEAKTVLDLIISMDGFYAEQAIRLKKSL